MENITQSAKKMLIAGERLKKLRTNAALTQEKLCELINNLPENKRERSYHQISQMENGKREISLEYAYLLSKALNVSQEYLLLESDYTTEEERISAISRNTMDNLEICTALIENMGYKIITMENKEDKTINSMHRDYKKITILSDDSPEDVLTKIENTPPVRYYILQSPSGSKATIDQDEFYKILHNLLNYTKFEMEKHFQKFSNHFMK